MRIDIYLTEYKGIKSRTKAQEMIEKRLIKVDGKICDKSSFNVNENNIIEILDDLPFVSKGGDKLQRAIDAFNFEIKDKVFLDVGASNGGFTDCLLQHGAKKVYAIDVGENQLEKKISENPRVVVMDNTNARFLSKDMFEENDLSCVSDVSFISLTMIIPVLSNIVNEMVLLIKPQFECGKKALNKNGIVSSEKDRQGAIDKVSKCLKDFGFDILGLCVGAEGKNKNTEYVIYANKK